MIKITKRIFSVGITFATIFLTFVPDSLIGQVQFFSKFTYEKNLLADKLGILVVSIVISSLINILSIAFCRKIVIKRRNYSIQIEYGNLFNCKNCQKVIPFDECFTSKIGEMPYEIKKTSICGQYLLKNHNVDVNEIIKDSGLNPERGKSKYNNMTKYKTGSIVPYQDSLFLAFAMLDSNGRAYFPTKEAYLGTLETMWSEIHKYYKMMDVCIPVLGGGLTTIGESNFTQQDLVDIIIESYKLYAKKIKNPNKLRIVCRKKDGVMLRKVGETI